MFQLNWSELDNTRHYHINFVQDICHSISPSLRLIIPAGTKHTVVKIHFIHLKKNIRTNQNRNVEKKCGEQDALDYLRRRMNFFAVCATNRFFPIIELHIFRTLLQPPRTLERQLEQHLLMFCKILSRWKMRISKIKTRKLKQLATPKM